VRCVSTKLTEADYATCLERAGSRSLGEWAREVLLAAATRRPIEELLLGEVAAPRTIVLTVQFALGAGETLTPDLMHRLIDRADAEKLRQAQARVTQGTTRTAP
jgi:L-amino acid N-acyltransferase YncA